MTSCEQIGVSEFYRGKDVLVTGATGFIGKVLLEKLLRCCEVRKVFVLIRPKRGKTIEERKKIMFQSELFRRIREEKADVLNKAVFLQGDISKKNVGLSQTDTSLIIENVSIVIHCAASVRFSMSLREAIAANVSSMREMADLCRNIRNLLVFVYVSTVFCNCDKKEIKETVNPLQVPVQGILKAVELLDEEALKALECELSNGRPNTYLLTKAMAENLLVECYMDLPWTIVRPSVVVASWKEPIPGWVEGLQGATGILTGNLKAVLSSIVIDEEKTAELIPVDSLVNVLLVAAWDKATGRSVERKVYNLTSTVFSHISWGDVLCYFTKMFWRCPPTNIFLTYRLKTTKDLRVHQTRLIFKDYIPAILADLYFIMQGKKMRFLKSCKDMNKLQRVLRPFMMTEWSFQAKNTIELLDKLPSKDKEVFSFDIRNINWKTFMENYVLGIRRFILKEDPETIQKAKESIIRRHIVLTKLVVFLCSIVLYKSIGFTFKYSWYILKVLLFKVKIKHRSLLQML